MQLENFKYLKNVFNRIFKKGGLKLLFAFHKGILHHLSLNLQFKIFFKQVNVKKRSKVKIDFQELFTEEGGGVGNLVKSF